MDSDHQDQLQTMITPPDHFEKQWENYMQEQLQFSPQQMRVQKY